MQSILTWWIPRWLVDSPELVPPVLRYLRYPVVPRAQLRLPAPALQPALFPHGPVGGQAVVAAALDVERGQVSAESRTGSLEEQVGDLLRQVLVVRLRRLVDDACQEAVEALDLVVEAQLEEVLAEEVVVEEGAGGVAAHREQLQIKEDQFDLPTA